LPRRAANAVRLLAKVLIRMPNQATPEEPTMPITLQMRMRATLPASRCRSTPKYTTMMPPISTSRMRMSLIWVIRYVLQVS
jgi:hypothetical protein